MNNGKGFTIFMIFLLAMFIGLMYFLKVGVCMSIAKDVYNVTYDDSSFDCARSPFMYDRKGGE